MICRICNKDLEGHGKGYHMIKLHKISYKDYIAKYKLLYPNDFPIDKFCVICGVKCKGTTCSHKCNGIKNGNRFRGGKAWNSGLTKYTDARIAEHAAAKIGKPTGIDIWERMSPETRKLAARKVSTKAAIRLSDPTKNPMYGKTHTPEAVKKIFTHRKITGIEKRIKDFLDQNNIGYTFQFFITKNEICKSFDFKIKNIPLIIEVDGDYWHGGPDCKMPFYDVEVTKKNDIVKTKLAEDNGYKVIRIWESEIKKDFENVKKRILNEINEF